MLKPGLAKASLDGTGRVRRATHLQIAPFSQGKSQSAECVFSRQFLGRCLLSPSHRHRGQPLLLVLAAVKGGGVRCGGEVNPTTFPPEPGFTWQAEEG